MNSDHIRDTEGARAVWEVKSRTKEGRLGKKRLEEMLHYLILK